MDLFSTLKTAQGVTMLSGLTLRIGDPDKGQRVFKLTPERMEREERTSDKVLLTIHYYSHILARYPRDLVSADRSTSPREKLHELAVERQYQY